MVLGQSLALKLALIYHHKSIVMEEKSLYDWSQVYVNPSSRPNTPSVVVKAPSTESIKSWNISVAESLIRKSEIEALEAEVLAEREEEEFDPFDTTKFEDPSEDKREEGVDGGQDNDDVEDPFDTSEFPDFEKEERLKREAEEEERKKAEVDLLTDGDELGGEFGDPTGVFDQMISAKKEAKELTSKKP